MISINAGTLWGLLFLLAMGLGAAAAYAGERGHPGFAILLALLSAACVLGSGAVAFVSAGRVLARFKR